jgi:hypothetical protein
MSALAPTLQAFFTDRLIRQRRASGHTIAAYRDTLRLLLCYASQHTGITPSRLDLADLDAPVIAAFLDHLEHQRGNTPAEDDRPPTNMGGTPSATCCSVRRISASSN